MSLDRTFQRLWYGGFHPLQLALIPLSWLFGSISAARRAAFRAGVFRSYRVSKPVVVVGNLTVGGTGKTPFTIWLANMLEDAGYRVGIVLRGYGGTVKDRPTHVTAESDWREVGDEACLLARRTRGIVVAGSDRVADARLAIELGAQVIVSDDGLQHYRLERDVEIVVVDAVRQLGNGRLLPAGPLRESKARMSTADLQVVTCRSERVQATAVTSSIPTIHAVQKVNRAINLATHEVRLLASFRDRPIHAVAAIGHPEGFFEALRSHGLDVREHAYPDHAKLEREQLAFADDGAVLMTEKDAVKCGAHVDERHWAVPLEIELDDADRKTLHDRLMGALASA